MSFQYIMSMFMYYDAWNNSQCKDVNKSSGQRGFFFFLLCFCFGSAYTQMHWFTLQAQGDHFRHKGAPCSTEARGSRCRELTRHNSVVVDNSAHNVCVARSASAERKCTQLVSAADVDEERVLVPDCNSFDGTLRICNRNPTFAGH